MEFFIIKKAGVPIAAPSANSSGKPSPTTAEHVFEDLNRKINIIIDGGRTNIGLESTILSLADPNNPVLLRPGKISKNDIEKAIGKIIIHKGISKKLRSNEKAYSPGLKYKHYSPVKAKVILIIGKSAKEKIAELRKRYKNNKKKVELIAEYKKERFARDLFFKLREADRNNVDFILIRGSNERGIGMAIINRLKRAASKIIET